MVGAAAIEHEHIMLLQPLLHVSSVACINCYMGGAELLGATHVSLF